MIADPAPLPVHGFVLAGGQSARMGRDKALLSFRGRPMVEIAAEKLRFFCANTAIAGNREDLRHVAPVVPEARIGAGPIAGIEAGLRASAFPWALFLPVDVPLAPASLLFAWTRAVVEREGEGTRLSVLRVSGRSQPAFCLLHQTGAEPLSNAIDHGGSKLTTIFEQVAGQLGHRALWIADAEAFVPQGNEADGPSLETCFTNINTPGDLAALDNPRPSE